MLTAGMRRYPLLSPKHSLWYRCYWKVLNPNTSRGCNQRPGQRFFRLPPPPQAKGSQSALIFQLALLVFLPPIGCPSRFQITCAKLNSSWLFYFAAKRVTWSGKTTMPSPSALPAWFTLLTWKWLICFLYFQLYHIHHHYQKAIIFVMMAMRVMLSFESYNPNAA